MSPKADPKPPKKSQKAAPTKLNFSAAADRLGLTRQAIGQWAAKPGAPVESNGGVTVVLWPAFARWREGELCRVHAEEATASMRRQLDATQSGDTLTRKLRADARKAEIEVELLERSVVKVSEVEQVIAELLNALRAALVSIPRTWAAKLIGAKTVVDMEQRLHVENVRLMGHLSAPSFGAANTQPADEAKAAA